MAGRPLGRKNIRSYMAAEEMERLRINPIEGALKAIEELDDLIKMNVDAYKSMRGYSERQDQGSAYLANAVRAVATKKDTYLALAKFKYPTLTAIGIKDLNDGNSEKAPLSTHQAIDIIKSDFFAPEEIKSIDTKKVIEAMETHRDRPFLPQGDANK